MDEIRAGLEEEGEGEEGEEGEAGEHAGGGHQLVSAIDGGGGGGRGGEELACGQVGAKGTEELACGQVGAVAGPGSLQGSSSSLAAAWRGTGGLPTPSMLSQPALAWWRAAVQVLSPGRTRSPTCCWDWSC
jgi:hypothetical protein